MHTSRTRLAKIKVRVPIRSQESERLADRRFGGMAIVEYLSDLFAASPLELFSRVSVLNVLDHVKKDRDLFPDGARLSS